MVMFFDLNVCPDGARDQSRREAAAMAMQLGYTGIATAHIITGVMQESDRGKVRPLKPDFLMAALPGVSDSTIFHRRLLGVPEKVPFKQYSRITVVVADQVQAAALNPANPVLQSYDIVAVQPTNQKTFAQACTTMEVDVITLNMCQRLQFRIKSSSLIEAAVERGIFFEIEYGPALEDVKARKQLFANTQMLVEVCRGRSIIVSSGAKSAAGIRGPNDVANMATLFGLTMEQAKAAISKNCNSVLLRGYTRKNTFKAAIAVDDVKKPLFDVPAVWDPLSTEGADLLLESDAPETSNPSNPSPMSKKRKRK